LAAKGPATPLIVLGGIASSLSLSFPFLVRASSLSFRLSLLDAEILMESGSFDDCKNSPGMERLAVVGGYDAARAIRPWCVPRWCQCIIWLQW